MHRPRATITRRDRPSALSRPPEEWTDTALSRLEQAQHPRSALGTGVEGSAVELVVNAWMAASTVAMSNVRALCDALAVDHATFVRVLAAGPLAMPCELQKVGVMDDASYAPGFAVQLALNGLELAAAAAAPSPLFQAVRNRLEATAAAGYDNDDLAAVDYLRKPPS
ncbi:MULTISPECIES: NAD-binding protein [unclassified Streptomyces]|uniref:NAD-binding protein n=1 Tax=unclassified Streptomyces TaxID=2593676 RepID=UPI002256C7F3|nr:MULTISPECIES: NAD-binding protein [unclassified Streptomyces]WSP59522.1 NAD-binding protein [Streptomyces sp. NBC_01241]WSU19962.1 NAD-binding protein [Streptomyces sp. NBC_01108]MCX4791305.1 NAD-binding protein [Streptomyces sp. NBC_01221]MCX4792985.1 NAD-binding protein [Streptomyces sp. NBC_01242]WSP60882.1 NAD-binding protein [Streptomyces sp. NBC_01240]